MQLLKTADQFYAMLCAWGMHGLLHSSRFHECEQYTMHCHHMLVLGWFHNNVHIELAGHTHMRSCYQAACDFL